MNCHKHTHTTINYLMVVSKDKHMWLYCLLLPSDGSCVCVCVCVCVLCCVSAAAGPGLDKGGTQQVE